MTQRIIYAGTPDFAVPALQALLAGQGADYEVVAVYTQPDRPAGRGRKLQPGPVKQCALQAGVPVYQPTDFKLAAEREALAALKPDLLVVAAYGLLLPAAVLGIPRCGCVNLHASLLPRWRGAAPIQRAIEAGDAVSGITLMQMDVGLDTGAMLAKAETPISDTDSGQTLHDRLATLGASLLMQHLPALLEGTLAGEAQDETQASYAKKLSKAEGEVDFSLSALQLARKIRAMSPWPVCYTRRGGQPLRLWMASLPAGAEAEVGAASPGTVLRCSREGLDIATADGVLRITRLQLPGGKPLAAADFANAHDLTGEQLGS